MRRLSSAARLCVCTSQGPRAACARKAAGALTVAAAEADGALAVAALEAACLQAGALRTVKGRSQYESGVRLFGGECQWLERAIARRSELGGVAVQEVRGL